MKYREELQRSIDWILSVQNDDGGWGIVPGQISSIVNTAEALYVLGRGNLFNEEFYKNGINFIESNAFIHIQDHGPCIRYISYALMPIINKPDILNKAFIDKCVEWLIEAKNDDNGWGHSYKDRSSSLFSTAISIISLKKVRTDNSLLLPSYQWLLSKAVNDGWSLSLHEPASTIVTSYITYCFSFCNEFLDHNVIEKAKNFLLRTRDWGFCEEVMPGTIWKHCSYTWVIPALVALGENPFGQTIADGVRYVNNLNIPKCGWGEGIGENKTVRAQFWAVHALSAIQDAFDPSYHILNMSQNREKGYFTEPGYITIAPETKWTTVISAQIYRILIIFLFILSVFFLFGWHRLFSTLPPRIDTIFSVLLLILIIYLLQGKDKLFPKWTASIKYIFIILSILGFFNLSLLDFMNFVLNIKDWIVNVFNK